MLGDFALGQTAPGKENILIINERNISKLTNAVYPEYQWVISFMIKFFRVVLGKTVFG